MSPRKQPLSLEKLCLEITSELIIHSSYVCKNHKLGLYNKGFQILEGFIERYVPSLLRCNLFHTLIRKISLHKVDGIHSDIVVFLLKTLINPEVQHLSFSDLIYGGSVNYEVLDSFETGFAHTFPYLPRLVHLDLSTHKSEVSLPSCSYDILLSIGNNCPNLRILNLNNNNRVTDECLKCLGPRKFNYYAGCPLLEEIYIQESSVTDKGVIWLLKTFRYIQKIGHSDMGSILRKYVKSFRRSPYSSKPRLNLTYIDNSESTYIRSDRGIISLISDICPQIENIRVRVCDEDCLELYRLPSLIKLELRFYTGIHHVIGNVTLSYFEAKGSRLSSLTIFCNELESRHVVVITSKCHQLNKLFLHANTFTINDSFDPSDNLLAHLKVLTIRIGQHEMDESQFAAPLVQFMVEENSAHLEEIYLLLVCRRINHAFFQNLLSACDLPRLETFIYDAPRRNRELPVIPLCADSALLMLDSCPALHTLGNVISWQVTPAEVCQLKDIIRKNNYEVNLLHRLQNRLNTKYF